MDPAYAIHIQVTRAVHIDSIYGPVPTILHDNLLLPEHRRPFDLVVVESLHRDMFNHIRLACVVAPLSWRVVAAGSLEDIDHVVLFMQENRAFDHYFGTMAGVRGFADPNVHYNNNRSVFHQFV